MTIGDRYKLGDSIAVEWNANLAAQFPNADHRNCRQYMQVNVATDMWEPFDPPRCCDYHCPRCGAQVNVMGNHHRTTGTNQCNQ